MRGSPMSRSSSGRSPLPQGSRVTVALTAHSVVTVSIRVGWDRRTPRAAVEAADAVAATAQGTLVAGVARRRVTRMGPRSCRGPGSLHEHGAGGELGRAGESVEVAVPDRPGVAQPPEELRVIPRHVAGAGERPHRDRLVGLLRRHVLDVGDQPESNQPATWVSTAASRPSTRWKSRCIALSSSGASPTPRTWRRPRSGGRG